MIQIRVHERPPICEGCRHGMVMRGPGTRVTVHCGQIGQAVPADLTSCSRWWSLGSIGRTDYDSSWSIGRDARIVDPRPEPGKDTYL